MTSLSHAARQILRRPAFAALAVAILALGFGAALAVIEIADSVLLQPLPFRSPDALVNAWQSDLHGGGARITVTGADFLAWKNEVPAFEGVAAVSARGFNMVGADQPERIDGAIVSAEFFSVMGAAPIVGSVLSPGPRQAVLSESLWRSRFGGERAAVGRTLTLDGEPVVVAGVMPSAFRYPPGAELWVSARTKVPEHPTYKIDPDTDRSRHYLTVVARLRPGMTLEQASASLRLVQERLARDHPDDDKEIGAFLVPLRDQLYGSVRPLLFVLLGVALLLLCVAWANVAHLFLVRAAARAHEVAVRVALGATRARLWSLFFAESMLISLAAAALGLWLGSRAAPLLVAGSPQAASLPQPALSFTVIAAALGLAVAAAASLGMLAALQPVPAAQALNEGGRSGTGGRAQAAVRRGLLVFEVALSLVLLLGAGLLLRSFRNVVAVDPGFVAGDVLAADLPLPAARYPDKSAQLRFATDLLRRLRADPRVEWAGLVSRLPLSPSNTVGDLTIPGREADAFPLDLRLASDGYFEALRIPLREGRTLAPGDLDPRAPPAVVINEAAARRAFGGQSALGKRIIVWGEKQPSEIVGVVGNIRHTGLDQQPRPEAFRPLGAVGWPNLSLVVRGKVRQGQLSAAVREAVSALDGQLPIVRMQPMEQRVDASLALRRFTLGLLSAMALAALLLASAGIYGVTSWLVSQRARELGVRLALGATPRGLVALLARETLGTVAIGSAVGLVAGGFLSRLLRGFLFEVAPVDAPTFAGLTLLLALVAAAATVAAARRATSVDPAEALRAS